MENKNKRIIGLCAIASGSLIIAVCALFMFIGSVNEILNPTGDIDGMFLYLVNVIVQIDILLLYLHYMILYPVVLIIMNFLY